MPIMFGGLWLIWALWSLLPLIALMFALRAAREARALAARVAALEAALAAGEARVEGVAPAAASGPVPAAPWPTPSGEPAASFPPSLGPEATPWSASPAAPPAAGPTSPPLAAPVPERAPRLDLEQRIGARWATWVGVVAILFAVSFFLRWAFESNLIGPGLRVILGAATGAGLLGAGLGLHRRRDVPYLSEGLAGGGLGILYLSLYAAYDFYGFLAAGPAFGAMFAVTLAGVLVAVLSGRQAIAMLSLLGGLVTPVLLASESPDERVLLGYLFVLDLAVLAVARFRSWPALNWLAWLGTALLLAPSLLRDPEPPHLLARLALLSALFLLFLAVPLAREWSTRAGERDIDLILVTANAAGYFAAVYWTLEASLPGAEGPYALGLAVLYAGVAAESRRRVPDDETPAVVHLGIADVFLTLGIALAIDGPWITLAWAAQGLVLLSVAPRVITPMAVWGGLAALVLATIRAAAFDLPWPGGLPPRLTPADVVHVAVVGCLVWGGIMARRVRPDQLRLLTPDGLRALLWILAPLLAAALIWRETAGLWPSALLAVLALVLGGLARMLREPRAPTFAVALPLVGLALGVHMFASDAALARGAASTLVNPALLVRIAGSLALILAGYWLASAEAEDGAGPAGRAVSAGGALALLIALSLGWTDHQRIALREALRARATEAADAIRWRTSVGLSALWALYAGATLGWGFRRGAAAVRYAGLGLLGIVAVKVFVVDLAEVATVYRIVSFLVLGVVLIGVSVLYQKGRAGPRGRGDRLPPPAPG